MITKTTAFKIGDQMFNSFEEAQQAELVTILSSLQQNIEQPAVISLAEQMLLRKTEVVDVLTMTERSRAKARKINGGSKKRKIANANSSAVNAMLQDIKQ